MQLIGGSHASMGSYKGMLSGYCDMSIACEFWT